MTIINKISNLSWHPFRRWAKRELTAINKIIIHQELGEGDIEAVNRYHINPNHISGRGCPHFCYHYGIEKYGEVVQANELSQVCWHTTGQNDTGIGIMLVGNFAGPGHDMGTSEVSPKQLNSLKELCDYLINAFGLSNQYLYGHYHYGKPACPGYVIQEWIEKRRSQFVMEEWMWKILKTPPEIQKRLNRLGYKCGNEDGIISIQTMEAIRAFQKDNGLLVDGVVGPNTWKHLLVKTMK